MAKTSTAKSAVEDTVVNAKSDAVEEMNENTKDKKAVVICKTRNLEKYNSELLIYITKLIETRIK